MLSKKSLFLLAGVIIIASNFIHAQKYEWTILNAGLNIRSIAAEGSYLWAGTESGLVQFNKTSGTKTVYNKNNSGLRSSFVNSVLVDKQGNKWIGTRETGLYKFSGGVWTNYSTADGSLPADNIQAVVQDSAGVIWAATYGGGLVKRSGSTWTVYDTLNVSKPIQYLYSLAADQYGFLWLGTSGDGIIRFDGAGEWVWYSTDNYTVLKSDVIRAIAVDKAGNKWFGTESGTGGGLYKWDGSQFTLYSTGSLSLNVYGIAFDPQGKIWISTYGGGLGKMEGTTFTAYNKTNSGLPDNALKSLYIDADGVKWIGSEKKGLVRFDDAAWKVYNLGLLPNNSVFSMANDAAGNKWIGTKNYLIRYANGTTEEINLADFLTNPSPGLPTNFNVWSIAFDSSGNKWIGTYDGGLVRLSPLNVPKVYNKDNSLMPSNNVYSVVVDKQQVVWAGTGAGLVKYDGVTFKIYNTQNSPLPGSGINSLAMDKNNRLWIATSSGLARFDGVNWSVYNTTSGLPSNYTFYVAVDSANNKWVGTGAGLAKFDNTAWTTYNTSNSQIPSNTVQFVAADAQGNVWLGTGGYITDFGYGLTMFDGSKWTTMNKSNSGLMGNEVSSFFIDKDGSKCAGVFEGGVCIFKEPAPTATGNPDNVKPAAFSLEQNYPNPFNPETIINYTLSADSRVTLKIFNVLGREVAMPVSAIQSAGSHSVSFSARTLPGGIYFYTLQSGSFSITKKMILLK